MTNKEIFLETADKIGKRLVKQAIWNKNICTWNVNVPDRTNYQSKKLLLVPAGGAIYQGTAGIAVFLCELYKQNNDIEIKKTAIGAVKHAIGEAKKLPLNSFGFHSGRVGIAYAANKYGQIFNNEEYLKIALDLVLEMKGNENKDFGIDVIGGAGGSIPLILQLAEFYNNDKLLEMAVDLGENLISRANYELIGWSWGSNTDTKARHLCGYAHGASGIGYALLELYNVTDSDYFLYAAEQAFLYERQFFSPQENNWPDFRHAELGNYYNNESKEQLKDRAKKGEFSPYLKKYMSAWCHGAPGIGLSRLRAYEILKDDIYKEEAERAIENTIKSISINQLNYSLCHGALGNAETLLYGYRVLGITDYLNRAEEVAIKGWESAENINIPWRSGTMNGISDPSFMLGEAGIGYFFLRLINENVPSILCPTNERTKSVENKLIMEKTFKPLQKDYILHYFEKSFSLLGRLDDLDSSFLEDMTFSRNTHLSDVNNAFNYLQKLVSFNESDSISYVKDLFQMEKIKYDLSIGLLDFTEEYIYNLVEDHLQDVKWNEVLIRISPFMILSEYKYDWNSYFLDPTNSVHNLHENNIYNVSYRESNEIKSRPITMFVYLLLKNLENRKTLIELAAIIKEYVQENADENRINNILINQLKELYDAGFIRVESVVEYENKIINSLALDLQNRKDLFNQNQKTKFLVIQSISNAENILLIEDELLRLFRIEEEIIFLYDCLRQLHIGHFYQDIFEHFSEPGIDKVVIYSELLERLKISFDLSKNLQVISQ